jgi:hypothetical protein
MIMVERRRIMWQCMFPNNVGLVDKTPSARSRQQDTPRPPMGLRWLPELYVLY